MVFTASLLGARHLVEVVENKMASLLVMSFAKALNRTSLCGRQVAQFSLKRGLVAGRTSNCKTNAM